MGVDHFLHALLSFIHPVAAFIAAVAVANDCEGFGGAAPIATVGAFSALVIHLSKASTRVASTAGTGECCNPLLSLGGTVLTVCIVVLSVLFAIVAIIMAVSVLFAVMYGSWNIYKRRRKSAEISEDNVVLRPSNRTVVAQGQ